jgi:hypothetical protein
MCHTNGVSDGATDPRKEEEEQGYGASEGGGRNMPVLFAGAERGALPFYKFSAGRGFTIIIIIYLCHVVLIPGVQVLHTVGSAITEAGSFVFNMIFSYFAPVFLYLNKTHLQKMGIQK